MAGDLAKQLLQFIQSGVVSNSSKKKSRALCQRKWWKEPNAKGRVLEF